MTNDLAAQADPTLNHRQAAYADLLVRSGINVQPGQRVRLRAEMAHRAFAHLVVQAAYRAGAALVQVDWTDPLVDYIRLTESPAASLDLVPGHEVTRLEEMLAESWPVLSLVGNEYPNLLAAVDPDRVQAMQMARAKAFRVWGDAISTNRIAWCVAAVPTPAWAAKVFPHLDADAGVAALWQTIFAVCRLDEPDPVAAWSAHEAALNRVIAYLHREQVRSLRFFDPTPGPDGQASTDLTVGLTDSPVWLGASSATPQGVTFLPNIPTEEIFSTPHAQRTQGWVRITKPAFPLDREVLGMWVRFEEGAVTAFGAETGQETLERFFQIPGADRLGEVALVDERSPINRSGLLFYNILFDENAVCHIAFGRAYAGGVAGGEQMSSDELAALGVNDSPIHLDVMIGSPTMQVTGRCADGREIPIIAQGQFTPAALAG